MYSGRTSMVCQTVILQALYAVPVTKATLPTIGLRLQPGYSLGATDYLSLRFEHDR